MGKLVCLIGKSSSGKDTIYRELLKDTAFKLKKVVLYTTRPIRDNETDGVQYHFVDEKEFERLSEDGKVIESRVYHTYHGDWRYFTVDDGKINLEHHNYLMIGTLDSYVETAEYFGREKVIPIVIEVDDGIRLQRAINREMAQETPKYEEMCRRFLADAEDFSDEKIYNLGINVRFNNENLVDCLNNINEYLTEYI
ncbi:MAG: guanylate kinase [Lachnospiraceae bacterium]|nr:guanylate kinase [Lachnospiraceae bacterium]